MAIDKMQMLSVVAPLSDLHRILRDLVLNGYVHIKNNTLNNTSDSLTMSFVESQMDQSFELGALQMIKYEKTNFKEVHDQLQQIATSIGMQTALNFHMEKELDYQEAQMRIREIYDAVLPLKKRIEEIDNEIEEKQIFLDSIKLLEGADGIDLSEIRNMKHINYHIGTLSNEGRIKLRDNYENISAVILHLGSIGGRESYLIFNPDRYEDETQKILKSLNFREISFPEQAQGNVGDVSEKMKVDIVALTEVKERHAETIAVVNKNYEEEIDALYTQSLIEEKIESMLENVAVTDNFFCFSAWVPESIVENLKNQLETDYQAIITLNKGAKDVDKNIVPPTKLKNNKFIRPFEALVNMYGIPNYNEIDPTLFLGITYIILFGAMFGDVGQGFVLFLAGFVMNKKLKEDKELQSYGQILIRLGISSMFFGFMYGSIFGNEHLLPALLIRPLENINFVLSAAIGFGVILLLISFGMSIYNLVHEQAYEEVFFGRNGLFGLLFYILLLVTVGQAFLKVSYVPTLVLAGLIVLVMAGMLFKKPLYGLLSRSTPHYEEGVGSYFVEGSFDLIETVLSLLSNSISFIRIGAFALNHVGLFLAFATMAQIANSPVAGAFIMVLGNIIIIALEGLIVLIQGLRLEYYELFSKYFKGDGREYMPIRLIEDMEEM